MAIVEKCHILENVPLQANFFRMVIDFPAEEQEIRPGQFVMVRTAADTVDPFLNRPMSITNFNRRQGNITLSYQVVGRGTRLMSEMTAGDKVEIIGPLGNGFTLYDEDEKIILVGGGAGIFPLIGLAAILTSRGKKVQALIGARNRELVLCEHEFTKMGCEVKISTDDGSMGFHGFATNLLEDVLQKEGGADRIYCCGPEPLMAGIAKIAEKAAIPSQVSLEHRMACGVGACLGCAIRIKTAEGEIIQKRVCHDGPVFAGSEVVFGG